MNKFAVAAVLAVAALYIGSTVGAVGWWARVFGRKKKEKEQEANA